MPRAPTEIRSIARKHTASAIRSLLMVATKGKNESAKVAASEALLNRGWGKPEQTHQHGGINGEDEIHLVIRTIVEGEKVKPR